MKKNLHVTATLDQPLFLEDFVEKLAGRRYDLGYYNANVPKEWKPIELASTETYVGGTNLIEDQGEETNMPFITRFLFTCIKDDSQPYRLTWSASLS